MLDWLYKRSRLYKAQQEINLSLSEELLAMFHNLKEKDERDRPFISFTDNVNQVLTNRNAGTSLFFIPGITFLLLVCQTRQDRLSISAFCPFDSGSAIAGAEVYLAGKGLYELESVWVEETYQRKGVGYHLISEMLYRLPQEGELIVKYHSKNKGDAADPLYRFYLKMGFDESSDAGEPVLHRKIAMKNLPD